MVSGQVALALVLLLSAGVMIRSFSSLLEVEPGFRTEDVMVAVLSLPSNDFRDRGSQHEDAAGGGYAGELSVEVPVDG